MCSSYSKSTFKELLRLDKSFTIHERNVQSLAIEVFKVVHNLSPEIMREVFVLKQSQKYCSRQIFDTRNVRTVHNGIETLSYLGIKIWAIIHPDIKSVSDILIFKRKIRL